MRGFTSLGSWLFWSASGLGILSLAYLSSGQSRQKEVRHSVSNPAASTATGGDQQDSAEKGGTDYFDGRSSASLGTVRSEKSTSSGCDDCGSAGKVGRHWAELRGFHDAAECADASSSIEFQQGCRAYAQEPHSPR